MPPGKRRRRWGWWIFRSTVENDGSNGPRGIPVKGAGDEDHQDQRGYRSARAGVKFARAGTESEAFHQPAAGPVCDQHAAAGGEQPAGVRRQRTMHVAQQLYEGVEIGRSNRSGGPDHLHAYGFAEYFPGCAWGWCAVLSARSSAPSICRRAPNFYASKAGAQEAHEAIRPTDVTAYRRRR